MSNSNLNASDFKQAFFSYEKGFKVLLAKIVKCYNLMIEDKVELENDENKIRDVLCS